MKEIDTSKLTESSFTLLILHLNAMLDSGKYDHITLEEVHQHIDNRTVLQWLEQMDGSFSFHRGTTYGDFENLYANFLQNQAGGYAGRENRKWGVQNRGLCLLIAWTNEAIQQGSGWKPDSDMFRNP